MIKNNESKVEITSRNIKYYTDRNYICKIGDIVSINVDTMPKMSHNKIIAICEICGYERELMFSKYNKNKNRQGYYSCVKCSPQKTKKSMLEKYGVEHISQTESNRLRMKEWMSSDKFKEKSKETLIENWGVDSYSKTEEFKKLMHDFCIENADELKEKRESTFLEKYGVKNPFETKEFRDKRDTAMVEKYGSTYSFHVPKIKEKIQNTFLKNYGHISPFGNKDVQEKAKNKVIEIYGVNNVWKNPEMIKYMIERKKELGIYYKDDEVRDRYRQFRSHVTYLSYKIKDKLLDNWDGKDFYSGKYIKDNFNLPSTHLDYPTIDHKIPIIYGYINNIGEIFLSSINNLCWTTRSNNVKKSKKLIFELDNLTKTIKCI